MGWLNLLFRALAFVGTGYIANDAIDAYTESKQSGNDMSDLLKEKMTKMQQKDFWLKAGILAAGVAAGMVATITVTQKRKLGIKK